MHLVTLILTELSSATADVDLCGHPSSLGLLREKGERYPLPPAAPPALHPKHSTPASSSGPPRTPVFAASFFIEHRAEVHEACGSLGPVSWVGLSRPQEASVSGPRRLCATAQEAQSGAARPQREHVRLGCELLLRTIPGTGSKRHSDGTFRGSAALDP